jgi:hypothetical protein
MRLNDDATATAPWLVEMRLIEDGWSNADDERRRLLSLAENGTIPFATTKFCSEDDLDLSITYLSFKEYTPPLADE